MCKQVCACWACVAAADRAAAGSFCVLCMHRSCGLLQLLMVRFGNGVSKDSTAQSYTVPRIEVVVLGRRGVSEDNTVLV